MKKVATLTALALLTLLIVLPVTNSFNPNVGNPVLQKGTLVADGFPGPLPKKLHSSSGTLLADGFPGPLPKKLHSSFGTLLADGFPGPLPKKFRNASNSLVGAGRISA